MATSSAAGAAGGIVQPLPTFNYSGPNAGVYLQKQNEAELAYQQAVADLQAKKNTAYHQYGLDTTGAVDPYSQFGMYQSQLSKHEADLAATDEAAQQRNLGSTGLAMQGERALRYQQGAEDLALQSDVANIGSGYTSGQQAALSARNQAILDAQLQAIAMGGAGAVTTGTTPAGTPASTTPAAPPNQPGPTGAGPGQAPAPNKPVPPLPPGQKPVPLPSGTHISSVWNVNTASTWDAVNAAKQNGGSIVITEGDPNGGDLASAGVPYQNQINSDANDSPEMMAQKIQQTVQEYPSSSGVVLDLESQNFRGYEGSPQWNNATQYAQAIAKAANGLPVTISTEGVKDFNYGAFKDIPNVTFAPQAYNGDMSPKSVMDVVQQLLDQGIPRDKIVPVIAPGQDVGSWDGPVSVFGTPTTSDSKGGTSGSAGSGTNPLTQSQLNTLTNALGFTPSAAIQQAYQNALPAPTTALQTLAQKMVYSSSRPGME